MWLSCRPTDRGSSLRLPYPGGREEAVLRWAEEEETSDGGVKQSGQLPIAWKLLSANAAGSGAAFPAGPGEATKPR